MFTTNTSRSISWWKKGFFWFGTIVSTGISAASAYFMAKTVQEDEKLESIQPVIMSGLASGFFLQLAINRWFLMGFRDVFNRYKNKFIPYEPAVLTQIATSLSMSEEEYVYLGAAYFSVRMGIILEDIAEKQCKRFPELLFAKCKGGVLSSSEQDTEMSNLEQQRRDSVVRAESRSVSSYETYGRYLGKYISWRWLSFGVFSSLCYTTAFALTDQISEENWREFCFLYASGCGFLTTGIFLGDLIENITASDKQKMLEDIGYFIFASLNSPGRRYYNHILMTLAGIVTGWLRAYNQRTIKTRCMHMEDQLSKLEPYMRTQPEFFRKLQPYLKHYHTQPIERRRKAYLLLKWIMLLNGAITPLQFANAPWKKAMWLTASGYGFLFFYWLIQRQNYSPYNPDQTNAVLRYFSPNLITAGSLLAFSLKIRWNLWNEMEYSQFDPTVVTSKILSTFPWAMLGAFYVVSLVSGNEDELKPIEQKHFIDLLYCLSKLTPDLNNTNLPEISLTPREIAVVMERFESFSQQSHQEQHDVVGHVVPEKPEKEQAESVNLTVERQSLTGNQQVASAPRGQAWEAEPNRYSFFRCSSCCRRNYTIPSHLPFLKIAAESPNLWPLALKIFRTQFVLRPLTREFPISTVEDDNPLCL